MGYWSEPSQRSARCAALDENVQCTFCASSFGTHSAAHPLWLAWGLHLETTSLSIQQTFFSFYPYHFYHTYILVFLPLSSQRFWLPWSSHIKTLVFNIHIWNPIFSYSYWYWLLQITPVQAKDMMPLNIEFFCPQTSLDDKMSILMFTLFSIFMIIIRGAFFAWRAPILSWPRIMCSQVHMLKFLEPSREMP